MSLRTLLTLMSLVSLAMIVAVIYTKVIIPPGERTYSVGEIRAMERVCEAQCERKGPEIVREGVTAPEIARLTTACRDACVEAAVRSRDVQGN